VVGIAEEPAAQVVLLDIVDRAYRPVNPLPSRTRPASAGLSEKTERSRSKSTAQERWKAEAWGGQHSLRGALGEVEFVNRSGPCAALQVGENGLAIQGDDMRHADGEHDEEPILQTAQGEVRQQGQPRQQGDLPQAIRLEASHQREDDERCDDIGQSARCGGASAKQYSAASRRKPRMIG